MKYLVKRAHIGDRAYEPGDEREARASDVAHLVANGVLVRMPRAKAAAPVRDKAEPRPRNKARS